MVVEEEKESMKKGSREAGKQGKAWRSEADHA